MKLNKENFLVYWDSDWTYKMVEFQCWSNSEKKSKQIRDEILKNREVSDRVKMFLANHGKDCSCTSCDVFQECMNGISNVPYEEYQKLKEDAEQWKFYYDGGLNGLMDIKERLKKEINLIKNMKHRGRFNDYELQALQKILGEKK